MKKTWSRPELIILSRSHTRPEEVVLAFCKGNNVQSSYMSYHNKCDMISCIFTCQLTAIS